MIVNYICSAWIELLMELCASVVILRLSFPTSSSINCDLEIPTCIFLPDLILLYSQPCLDYDLFVDKDCLFLILTMLLSVCISILDQLSYFYCPCI